MTRARFLPNWLSAVSRVTQRVSSSSSSRKDASGLLSPDVVTMNSHVNYGLHYPYNYVGAGLVSPAGAPFYPHSGGGYNSSFRLPYFPRSHSDKTQAYAYASLCQQFMCNFVFSNSERFHPRSPVHKQCGHPSRPTTRVRRSASNSDIQERLALLDLGDERTPEEPLPGAESVAELLPRPTVDAGTTPSSSSSDSGLQDGDETPDFSGSVVGDLDSCLGDEVDVSSDEDEDSENMEGGIGHIRGIKRLPETRGRSPIQKRPRSEERDLIHLTKAPWSLPHGLSVEDYQKLSDAILEFYEKKEQAPDLYVKKMKLRDALYSVMRGVFPYCGLYVVGSSMNGFGSHTSDMDLCLMLSYNEIDQKKEATEILRMLDKSLKKCSFLKELNLICAKVPILKFKDKISDVECDLNINNSVGIRNTHLLNAYSKMDWRVSCLVLFVKHWAKLQNINDASQGTISSYSLVLMVIHYLQCGCHPPVVPSLQQKYPHKFSATTDIRHLTLNEKLPPYTSPNKDSLGELFMGFLNYYSNVFNFEEDAISVRMGRRIPREVAIKQNPIQNPPSQWKCLCIEEPFNLSNTARSVFDPLVFKHIRSLIQKSFNKLRQTRDVNSILDEQL